MQPFNITTGDRRKAARTNAAPLLISAVPRLETYAVRALMRRAHVSQAQAALIVELIGLSSGGLHD
jgi:hypothetical protein